MLPLFRSLCIAVCALLLGTGESFSYRVTPLTMNMQLGEGQTTKRMTVTNSDATAKAIVVTAHATTITEDGKRRMEEAESGDLLVFPPQALVQPGASQAFIIQWLGDPALSESRTYTLAYRQIPISEAPTGGAALKVMVNVLTTLSVQPPGGTQERIAGYVTAAGLPTTDAQGAAAIEITARNAGPFHAYLSDADLTLSAEGWRQRVDANDVLIAIGEGLVLPHSVRRFVYPLAPPAINAPISVELDFAERGFRGRR